MTITDELRRNIVELHGSAGADWLASIPERLAACTAKWALTRGVDYSSSYSYVLRVARSGGALAVLKLLYPSEDVGREACALSAFAGRGCVASLAYDSSLDALLLERAEPGCQLAEMCERDDQRATSIAARVVRTLHRSVGVGVALPSVELWRLNLRYACERPELTPFIRALAADALAMIAELHKSPSHAVLLHGDLHQFNILSSGENWIAVDPKGIMGEPACEIAPLVLNPLSVLRRPGLSQLVRRRIDQLCDEIGLERRRAYTWTFVRCVLAIVWSYEDHGAAPAEWIDTSKLLRHHAG